MKTAVGATAAAITALQYVPYLRDLHRGPVKPHLFTWVVWALAAGIIAAGQWHSGGGWGALLMATECVFCIAIVAFTLRRAEHDIVRSDWIALAVSGLAAGVWMITDRPTVSLALATATEAIAFVPTVRKSWNAPFSEPVLVYSMSTFAVFLSLFAMADYNFETVFNPVVWIVGQGAFVAMLVVRRSRSALVPREAQSVAAA